MQRREFLFGMAALALPQAGRAEVAPSGVELRIGLTPVFLDDQAAFLNRWRDYLSARSGLTVAFVQRSSYREIVEQILGKTLDMAWLCGYPYVMAQEHLRLLAVPLHLGRPEYHSYLIARHDMAQVEGIDDLAGRVFAFSDPNSFSGSLYPRFLLHERGQSAAQHFRRSFYTWSHRKVVEAVAAGLADGGAVAGYVWETLARLHPEITTATRVVGRSPSYGFPPFVVRADLRPSLAATLQRVFVDMRDDAEGARLLQTLNLDGFVPGDTAMYRSIREMVRLVEQR